MFGRCGSCFNRTDYELLTGPRAGYTLHIVYMGDITICYSIQSACVCVYFWKNTGQRNCPTAYVRMLRRHFYMYYTGIPVNVPKRWIPRRCHINVLFFYRDILYNLLRVSLIAHKTSSVSHHGGRGFRIQWGVWLPTREGGRWAIERTQVYGTRYLSPAKNANYSKKWRNENTA